MNKAGRFLGLLSGAGLCFGAALRWRQKVGPPLRRAGTRSGLRSEMRADMRADEIDVQKVFDHVADGVVVLDAQRNIILMNASAATLLGMQLGPHSSSAIAETFEIYAREGARSGERIEPDRWPGALALRGEFLAGREIKIRRIKAGGSVLAQVSTAPVKNSRGELVQVLVIYRDVTDRDRVDRLQREMAAIVESSEDAIIGKNTRGIVTSWNLGAEKIFGYQAAEMVGESIKKLVPPDRVEEEDEILAKIKRGEMVDHLETTRVRKDGSTILVSLTISPIRGEGGRIVGASKVARDITSRRRLERQAQQSQRMEAIGQLTGGIAHDFNNLLGVVMGNLDLLEPLLDGNAAALKRLQTAQKAALRGADLTRRLLAFSANEELHPTSMALNHAVRDTLELAQRALGPEIRIVTRLASAIPELMVDRTGLETVLLNLFVNARDAMPEAGVLTVCTFVAVVEEGDARTNMPELKPGQYACVSVSDTGHGMSRETLERVFEPFFTTKPRGRGTGLGLAMAYGFVKQSGGTVKIYSEPGYGTTVSFYLPLPPMPEARTPVCDGKAASQPRFGGCRVLIVDDDQDLLEIAGEYATELECTVLTASDAAAALKILESPEEISLMITDIIMPGQMSGAALAEKARRMRPQMRIVYCSGFPADALAERMSMRTDWPLLRKPYQRAEVHATLRRALAAEENVGLVQAEAVAQAASEGAWQ